MSVFYDYVGYSWERIVQQKIYKSIGSSALKKKEKKK